MKSTDKMFYLLQASIFLSMVIGPVFGLMAWLCTIGAVAVIAIGWELAWRYEFRQQTKNFEQEMAAFDAEIAAHDAKYNVLYFDRSKGPK